MAICLNNYYLLIGHQTIIAINTISHDIKEITLQQPCLNVNKEKKSRSEKEDALVQTIIYDNTSRQYLITTDCKSVYILNNSFDIVRSFVAKRAISKAAFDSKNNVLIADKTGDVYIYKAEGDPECLLGHLSMLLDIKISSKGDFVVTSDRDEKIRVSRYPNAYNIECYCLGHSEFVSHIELWRDLVISGSGDGTIRAWDIQTGKQKSSVNTNGFTGDKQAFEEFKMSMAQEDVFVNSLPITNLRILQLNEQELTIAVSVHMISKLQIHYLEYINNGNDVKLSYINSVDYSGELIDFCLGLNNLYILTSESLFIYTLNGSDIIKEKCNYVDKFVNMYPLILKNIRCKDVKVLYKKTFDNVQEYLDRKKMRIDLKHQ